MYAALSSIFFCSCRISYFVFLFSNRRILSPATKSTVTSPKASLRASALSDYSYPISATKQPTRALPSTNPRSHHPPPVGLLLLPPPPRRPKTARCLRESIVSLRTSRISGNIRASSTGTVSRGEIVTLLQVQNCI